MKLTVHTPTHDIELEAVPKTSGRELFKDLCKSLGIQEHWWFGLSYKGTENENVWIDKSKKSLNHFQKNLINLRFGIKFYPEDVDELIETITIEYFFNHIRTLITKDEIFCAADTVVLLASYALQAKYGDYNKESFNEDFFKKQTLLPDRVLKQHKMDQTDWENSITSMWFKHRGLDKEEAMLEYLKLVQNLEMYGVTYFNIRNIKGTDLQLGVTALGLDMYKKEDKLNPSISFPWSEIKNLKIRGTKFIINPTDKTAKKFVIITTNERISKIILALGIGNHELYIRRRKPDTPDIVKMKEKANEVRKTKVLIRQKYNNERLAREEAERRETMYKLQLEEMKVELQRQSANILDAERTIRKLQEQLDDLRRTKEELENQKQELQIMMSRLEEIKNMEAAEKLKLEEDIRIKHEEVQRIQLEVSRKDEETRRLQEEVELARKREEEVRRRQEEERLLEEERRRRESEIRQLELEQASITERELEYLPNADNTLPEYKHVKSDLNDPIKQLQKQLEETRKHSEETELDKIHRINLLEGRDKFKTLKDIRKGNTIRRVEMFENM